MQNQIAALGLGSVGCATPASLAGLGSRVVGIDPDQRKIDSILSGRAPFREPGLDELAREGAAPENIPHIERLLCDPDHLGADQRTLVQKQTPETMERIRASRLPARGLAHGSLEPNRAAWAA